VTSFTSSEISKYFLTVRQRFNLPSTFRGGTKGLATAVYWMNLVLQVSKSPIVFSFVSKDLDKGLGIAD